MEGEVLDGDPSSVGGDFAVGVDGRCTPLKETKSKGVSGLSATMFVESACLFNIFTSKKIFVSMYGA